jgi:uncharacterized repeat protein (TIGR04138 family)
MSSYAMTKSLKRIAQIAKEDGRYKVDAYLFVQQSLAFAQLQRGRLRRQAVSDSRSESASSLEPHLTGQELCGAIRLYAQELYGLMAKLVVNSWGVRSTSDFGEIVYKLIEIGEMTKSEQDQREDFDGVYDFTHAFERDYRIEFVEEAE